MGQTAELFDRAAAYEAAATEALVDEAHEYACLFVDRLGCVRHWPDSASRCYGYHSDDMVGKGVWILFISADHMRAETERMMLTAFQEGRHEEGIMQVRKSGVTFPARTIWRKTDQGFVLVVQDLSHVARERSQLSAILDAVAEPVQLFDPEWRYVGLNKAAARLIGGDPSALVGKTLFELMPNASESEFFPYMQEAMVHRHSVTHRGMALALGRDVESTFLPLESGGICMITSYVAPDPSEQP